MYRTFYLVVGIVTLVLLSGSTPARADWPSSQNELQKTLLAPQIVIDDEDLAVDELNSFYAARDYKPAWSFAGQNNGETFVAFIKSIEDLIDYHGLQREDYAVELMQKLESSGDNDNRIKLELLVTDTLLRLAHDLHGDSTDLSDLYVGWNFQRTPMDIPTTLQAAVASNTLNEYIESLTPKNIAYAQLAQTLQKYRLMAHDGGWNKIAPGPTLLPNDRNPRVAQLRSRLMAEGYLPQAAAPDEQSDSFDDALFHAAQAYQLRNGLVGDGHIGSKALEALNIPLQTRIDQILANMERWRHMPDDFPPERFALVNIPDASIVIHEDGKEIYRGIVIVGRVDRKTPFIQSHIRSMIINPAWHVPTKIARKDILPKLRKDPHYLEKLGFVIRGNEDDPYGDNIDWKSMPEREFNFRLRQSPGDQNSLGRLKFDFDNDFAVYMHGTPHQELFQKNERTLSSGCIRLHDPEEVAEIYLSHNKDHWDKQRLEDEINSGKTHWVGLAKPMPLDVVYWTVFTDDAGEVNFRKDVYDYDRFLMQNMRSDSNTLESH